MQPFLSFRLPPSLTVRSKAASPPVSPSSLLPPTIRHNPTPLSSPAFSSKTSQCGALFVLGLAFSLIGSLATPVNAESPETAPTELKTLLSKIDTSANQHNVQGVLQFYSPQFIHSDGLTRPTLEQALTRLWKRYPKLQYRTELTSWQAKGNGFEAETVTHISGVETFKNRELMLKATLRSRQQISNQTIVRQDVLAEETQITAGKNPPTVKLSLPAQVKVGQEYSFDAIVEEPLGDDVLLGAALEEPVKPGGLIDPTVAGLTPLSAGGIFKVGRAPLSPGDRWLSAILVRHDGITMLTQRLRVMGLKEAQTQGSR